MTQWSINYPNWIINRCRDAQFGRFVWSIGYELNDVETPNLGVSCGQLDMN
jgi:hypothetical protein